MDATGAPSLKDAVGDLRGRGIEVRITGVEHGHRKVLESLGVVAANPNSNRGAIPSAAGAAAP
ncbi:hypothetical protein ACWD5F_14355 [Streptomyces sp. NPDC002499]